MTSANQAWPAHSFVQEELWEKHDDEKEKENESKSLHNDAYLELFSPLWRWLYNNGYSVLVLWL